MSRTAIRVQRRIRRKRGLRKRLFGTAERPRLTVYRSLKHIYAQIIDDVQGRTIAAASTRDAECKSEKTGNREGAAAVGRLLARRARDQGISTVQFDRNGLQYHGRVKAMADAAREGGLKF